MKKMFLWLWLLTKRLYKKPAFLAILVLIPVLTFCYQAATQGESGVMTIAIAQEGQDPLAQTIMDDLVGSSQLFSYRICDSDVQAQLLVSTGKADAAWIFPENMEEKMAAFLEDPDADNALVRVVQREENVAHMLTRERLGGAVYRQLFARVYLQYIRQQFPQMDQVSDEELMEYYDSTHMDGQLFSFESITGDAAPQVHYLLSPIRGILGILVVLCGMAAAMYYKKDSVLGTFGWIPQRLRPATELGCQMVAVVNVSLVSFVTLLVTGLHGNVLLELALLVLYSLCVAVFCMLLRSLVGSVRALGALMPLLVVIMLLVCPVLVDMAKLRLVQLLLPPTYYLNGVYNPMYLLYMAVFTLACGGLYLLSEKLQKRI